MDMEGAGIEEVDEGGGTANAPAASGRFLRPVTRADLVHTNTNDSNPAIASTAAPGLYGQHPNAPPRSSQKGQSSLLPPPEDMPVDHAAQPLASDFLHGGAPPPPRNSANPGSPSSMSRSISALTRSAKPGLQRNSSVVMRFEKQAATGAGSSMSKTDEPSQPLFFDMAIPDAKNKSAMKVVRALAVAAQYDRTVDNVIPLEEDVTPPTPISAGPGEQQPPSDPTDGQANVAPQSGQPTPFNTTGGEENPEKGQPQNSNATSNVAKTTSFSSLETTDEEELTIDKIVLRPRQHKLSVQSGECKCHESSQGLSTGGLAAAVMKDTDSLFVSACELCAKSIG
eukprot:1254678-Rhodomonas_salina.2